MKPGSLQPKGVIIAVSIVVFSVTGAFAGANMKYDRQHKHVRMPFYVIVLCVHCTNKTRFFSQDEQHIRTATPAEKIAVLEASKQQLLKKRKIIDEKMDEVRRRRDGEQMRRGESLGKS